MLITHDLGVVAQIADRVAVMQSGRIVEQAPLKTFFERPQHEYTQKLLNSLPTVDGCGRRPAPEERRPLLAVEDFRVYYPVRKGVFQRVVDHVKAVDGVSFELEPGSTLALVGESGCGKSTLGKSLLGLIPHHAGAIRFDGEDVTVARGEKRRRLCARMQIVFQDLIRR